MLVNNNDARPKSRSPNCVKNWYPGRITVPANLVFRLEIWDARDNGILPRSTPDLISLAKLGGGGFDFSRSKCSKSQYDASICIIFKCTDV